MPSPLASSLTNFLAHPHSNKMIGLAATCLSILVTLGLKRYSHYLAIASLYNLTARETEYVIELEQMVSSLPLVKQLRKDMAWEESRGYPLMSEEIRKHHFTVGTLSGKDKLAMLPIIFTNKE